METIDDKPLTLTEAHTYVKKRGVRISFGWFKTQVQLGKIPSEKILNSRGVHISALDAFIADHKEKA